MKGGKNYSHCSGSRSGKENEQQSTETVSGTSGKPVLYYSLNCFQQSPLVTDIILVTGAESVAFAKKKLWKSMGLLR